MGSIMSGDGSSEAVPAIVVDHIHALWDEVADFGAHETDAALAHLLRTLSDLTGPQNAFWLGAVRLGTNPDLRQGWRIRGIRRLVETPEDEQVYKVSRRRLDHGTSDEVTRAQVREAGVLRARLLRELAPSGFAATADHDVLYRARNIHDAIFVACPLNEDAESYYGWYRIGDAGGTFTPADRDLLAYALRALKWFHRRVMLHHGLLIAKAPLRPVERRLLSFLLTERLEKEIARDLDLTLATTHTYITDLFRKVRRQRAAGLTALWLGNSLS